MKDGLGGIRRRAALKTRPTAEDRLWVGAICENLYRGSQRDTLESQVQARLGQSSDVLTNHEILRHGPVGAFSKGDLAGGRPSKAFRLEVQRVVDAFIAAPKPTEQEEDAIWDNSAIRIEVSSRAEAISGGLHSDEIEDAVKELTERRDEMAFALIDNRYVLSQQPSILRTHAYGVRRGALTRDEVITRIVSQLGRRRWVVKRWFVEDCWKKYQGFLRQANRNELIEK